MDFNFDLQLFGGFFKAIFGGGSSSPAPAPPSVKQAAPGSVATQTAEMDGSRSGVQKRLRRGLNREGTDRTQGMLGSSGNTNTAMGKKLLGE